jgi:hypothetical protein
MKRTYLNNISEKEKNDIRHLYNILISEQPASAPQTASSNDFIDFNDYVNLARDIVNLKLCSFDTDFENIYPARTKENKIVIVATAKVDRVKGANIFYYKKGETIEFNVGSPVEGGIYFTNKTSNLKFYFNCPELGKEVTRVSTKVEDLLGQKGFFKSNSVQLQNYTNQLNDPRYFEEKSIQELAIEYKNSMGFNPLYYMGPKFFYKKLQNTTESNNLTSEQQQVQKTFAEKYGAVVEHVVSDAEKVNYTKINLKDYNNTFKDDYFMLVPNQRIQNVQRDFKQGNTLLSVDKESVFGCTRLLKTYKELFYKYKNNEYTTDSALSNIKPKLEYCYRKFRTTKLGGELFPFTNSNDKNLGPFLLKI